MAIENDGTRNREVWTAVSQHWYSKASVEVPTAGRLHHHLAILARPDALQRVLYHTESLCVSVPASLSPIREVIVPSLDLILNSFFKERRSTEYLPTWEKRSLFTISNDLDELRLRLEFPFVWTIFGDMVVS